MSEGRTCRREKSNGTGRGGRKETRQRRERQEGKKQGLAAGTAGGVIGWRPERNEACTSV